MDSTGEHNERTATAELLARAHALTEEGFWQEALEAIKLVKEFEPRNIYVLAFERQIEQLIKLSSSRMLTEEQREDILEAIPGLIERALDSPTARPATPSSPPPVSPQKEKQEKKAALTWLKDQYFQHANDYVAREEYTHALTEIRRVFIIDPDNETAREFEEQIEDLVQLQSSQPFNKREGVEAERESAAAKRARQQRIRLIAIAAVAVVVIALVLWFTLGRKSSTTPPTAAPADTTAVQPAPPKNSRGR